MASDAALQAAATANNWVFFNPNTLLNQYLAERTPAGTGGFQRIRRCQLLFTNPPPATVAQFEQAVGLSCPVTGATGAPNFFGSLFSFDGVHPSSEAHRLIAIELARAINTRYGTRLPTT